jgi:hypothetical protein
MNLWEQMFNQSEESVNIPTSDEFNTAWKWCFEKTNNEFVRTEFVLNLARNKSRELRRKGVNSRTAEIALVGIWKNSNSSNTESDSESDNEG